MKKFVATAIKVVAPSAGKSSNVSDAKKRSSKEDESEVVVSSPPAKSQQKSIADVLGIRKKGSPSKKINVKCNVGGKSLPTTKICVSCKILPSSNLSIFYFTEHSKQRC